MLLNSHISAYATCFVRKVCGLVRSTWGISLVEEKLGAARILNTKVAPWACAGRFVTCLRPPSPPVRMLTVTLNPAGTLRGSDGNCRGQPWY